MKNPRYPVMPACGDVISVDGDLLSLSTQDGKPSIGIFVVTSGRSCIIHDVYNVSECSDDPHKICFDSGC